MELKTCFVCLSEPENFIKCRCSALLCYECTETYLEFSKLNNTIIKCKCNKEFMFDEVPKNFIGEFSLMYFNYIQRNHFLIEKDNKDQIEKIISNVIEKRKKIIETKLPACLSLVINISLPHKIKEINKGNLKINDTKKICFNINCKTGSLNLVGEIYECNTCFSSFCLKCEKPMAKNHKCDKNDLASFNEKEKIVKCPKCSVCIERSEGCDFMTCNLCKTHFNYKTLEITGCGSFNKDFNLKTHENIVLDLKIENEEIIDLISSLKKPGKIKFKKLLGYLESEDYLNLYKEYSKIQNKKDKIKIYYEKLELIRKEHSDNELTLEKVKQIVYF